MSLATLGQVRKSYHRGSQTIDVLRGVDVDLQPGGFGAIQGPSGCGKSTLLLVLGGLLRPDSGTVHVADKAIYEMSADQRTRFRAQHIGFIFQQFHLVPYLNVEKNVLAAAMGVGGVTSDIRRRANELIEQFGLTERRKHAPGQLSTGERQRAALARALLNQPSILLADEPTGNLDPENTEIVLNELNRFAANGGSVLLVTHDDDVASAASTRYSMSDGCLQQTANTVS